VPTSSDFVAIPPLTEIDSMFSSEAVNTSATVMSATKGQIYTAFNGFCTLVWRIVVYDYGQSWTYTISQNTISCDYYYRPSGPPIHNDNPFLMRPNILFVWMMVERVLLM
jgi:hypothetical protein